MAEVRVPHHWVQQLHVMLITRLRPVKRDRIPKVEFKGGLSVFIETGARKRIKSDVRKMLRCTRQLLEIPSDRIACSMLLLHCVAALRSVDASPIGSAKPSRGWLCRLPARSGLLKPCRHAERHPAHLSYAS